MTSSATSASMLDCSVLSVFRRSFGRKGPPLARFYKITDFQRPYIWSQENIQKLLDDVDELRANLSEENDPDDIYDIDNSCEYFLGSICLRVVKEKGNAKENFYEVLDGQQRLTSLLILAYVLDKKVTECRNNIIQGRWTKVIKRLGERSCWQNLLVFTNPQSKRQMKTVYWSFMHDYGCLKFDAKEDFWGPKVNGMNIFEQTLYQDVQRFEYILEKGRFSVLILVKLSEAEQFFQGENNRGLPMTMLDLLKAYHMRLESDEDRLRQIGEIWHRLGLTIEKKSKEYVDSYWAEEGALYEQRKDKNPDWTSWLMNELVLPALLMQYGIEPWAATKMENLVFLKGDLGTYTGDYFIDEKLALQVRNSRKDTLFDLRTPVRPGLPFFQEIEQYMKLAQAVDILLSEEDEEVNDKSSDISDLFFRKKFPLDLDDRQMRILKLALIAWADRFSPVGILRSNNTWVDVLKVLAADGAFRIYWHNFARFLDRLKKKGERSGEEQIGAYERLRVTSLCKVLRFSEPENNLLFMPQRTSSPRECLRKFKAATHPDALKPLKKEYRKGYRNAYECELVCFLGEEEN